MQQRPLQFWLLGATFETKNLGVSALAEASLKCFFTHWPDSKVILQAYSKEPPYQFLMKDRKIDIERVQFLPGIRSAVIRHNSIYRLIAYAILYRMLPFQWFENFLKRTNPYFKQVMETDAVIDITGGDSFSDLYGLKRLIFTSLPKWLFILCRKRFIFLPQTHGPFQSNLSKRIARYLLNHAMVIYSRDQNGVRDVKELLGQAAEEKIKFIPDVAFVLDPQPFDSPLIRELKAVKQKGHILIGLNVSGLIYKSKAETQLFGLKEDYRELIQEIVTVLMSYSQTTMVLVPHVFGDGSMNENDIPICQSIYTKMVQKYPGRVLMSSNDVDHKQIKYLIGHCDFFLGARMHACIAAISQCIPALAMAYSGKFIGVFESVGAEKCVVDLRTEDKEHLLSRVRDTFEHRIAMSEKLRQTIPPVQKQVIEFLGEIRL